MTEIKIAVSRLFNSYVFNDFSYRMIKVDYLGLILFSGCIGLVIGAALGFPFGFYRPDGEVAPTGEWVFFGIFIMGFCCFLGFHMWKLHKDIRKREKESIVISKWEGSDGEEEKAL